MKNVSCCSGLQPVDSSVNMILIPSEVNGTININFSHTIPWEAETRIEISMPTKLSFIKNVSSAIITSISITQFLSSGLINA